MSPSPITLRVAVPLAATAGVMYFVGFAGFDQWWLTPFALVPLLAAVDGQQPVRSFMLGWLTGTVTHIGGFYWIATMLLRFSGFPLPLCLLFTVIVCAYQGLSIGLFALAISLMRSRGWDPFLLGAAAIAALEWAFPMLFPSFIGNALYLQPILVQTADLGGPTAVTFLVVAVNFAGNEVVRAARMGRRAMRPIHVGIVAALAIAAIAYGAVRIHQWDEKVASAPKTRVGIVQVNMGTFQKREDPAEGLRRHREDSLALEQQGVDLLVWPESSVVYTLPSGIRNVKQRVLGKVSTPTIFGAVRGELTPSSEKYYNTAFITDGMGEIGGHYDKVYLLAFGEYLPLGETFPVLYEISQNSGHFERGSTLAPLPFGEHRLATLICYEDILPGFVRKVMAASDPVPDMLVNVTNDSWFGETTEPWQHLALATFRSIEHRRWMVRATNSGVSAFIDPVGRIVKHTPLMERASIIQDVTFHDGRTVYARFGWLFDWVCAAAVLLALVIGRRRAGSLGSCAERDERVTGPKASSRKSSRKHRR